MQKLADATKTANKVVPQNSEKHQDQTGKVLNATHRLLKPKMTSSSQRAVALQKTSVLKPTKPIARSMKSTPVSGPCAEFGHDLEMELPFELIDLIKASPSTDPCHFYGKNGDDRLMICGNKQQNGKHFKLLISGPRDFKERTATISCTVSDLVCLSPRQDHFKENLEPMMPLCPYDTEANVQSNNTETMSDKQPGPSNSKMLNLTKTESMSMKKDLLRRNSSEKENEEATKHIQFEVVSADEEKKAAEMFQQDQDQCVQTASSLGSGNVIEELVVTPSRSQEVSFSTEKQQPMSEFALSEDLGLPDLFIASTSAAYDELSSIPNITWSEMNSAGEVIVEVCAKNDDEMKVDSNDPAVTDGLYQNDRSSLILGPEEFACDKNSNLNESTPADKQKNADDNDPDYVDDVDDVDADPDWETAEQPPKTSSSKPSTTKATKATSRMKKDIAADRAMGKIIHCKLCPYTAEYKSIFKCHLHNYHKMPLTEYREKFNFPLIRRDNADYSKDLTNESNNYFGDPDPYRYRCKLCPFSQVHMRHFRNHLKRRHKLTFQSYFEQFGVSGLYPSTVSGDIRKEETSSLCELCGRGFKKLSGLLSHLKRVHKKESKCIINRLHTERTEQNNRRSAILKNCPFCQEKFLKADINSHINREHQDHEDFGDLTEVLRKSISTSGSGKKTKTKVRTSTKPKTECPLCTYSSTDPENVYKHKLLIHSDLRKFVCPFCRSSFNTSLALKKHTKSKHQTNSNTPTTNESQCPTCKRVFVNKYKCNRHMLLHQRKAAEGLSCHLCHKSCTRPENLVQHMRKDHGETQKVICKLCGCVAHTTDELVSHKCQQKSKQTDKAATRTTADVSETSKRVEELTEDITAREEMDVTLEHEDIKDITYDSIPNSDNVLISESSFPAPSTSNTS